MGYLKWMNCEIKSVKRTIQQCLFHKCLMELLCNGVCYCIICCNPWAHIHLFPELSSLQTHKLQSLFLSLVCLHWGSNPSGDKIFCTCPDRPWGPPSLLYKRYRVFPGVKSGRSVTLTPHPLPVPWSWKGRAIPLLPLWAVWPVQSLSACARGQFIFFYHPAGLNSHEFDIFLALRSPSKTSTTDLQHKAIAVGGPFGFVYRFKLRKVESWKVRLQNVFIDTWRTVTHLTAVCNVHDNVI